LSSNGTGNTFKITFVVHEVDAAAFDGAAMSTWVVDALAALASKQSVHGWWRVAWNHAEVERKVLVVAAMFTGLEYGPSTFGTRTVMEALRHAVFPDALPKPIVISVAAESSAFFVETAHRVAALEDASTARLTRTLGSIQRRVGNAPFLTTFSGTFGTDIVISVVFASATGSDDLRETAAWLRKCFAGEPRWRLVWLDERLAPNTISFLARGDTAPRSAVPALFRSSRIGPSTESIVKKILEAFTMDGMTPKCVREARAMGVAALFDFDFDTLYERAIAHQDPADRAAARANGWL
jgi:hypothetical protein